MGKKFWVKSPAGNDKIVGFFFQETKKYFYSHEIQDKMKYMK